MDGRGSFPEKLIESEFGCPQLVDFQCPYDLVGNLPSLRSPLLRRRLDPWVIATVLDRGCPECLVISFRTKVLLTFS